MARPKKEEVPIPEFASAEQVGMFVGLQGRMIQRYAQQGSIPPQTEPGKHPLVASVLAIVENLRQEAQGMTAEKARDQARREKAQADSAEMQAGRDSGMLMLTADAKRMWSDGFVKLRDVVVRSSLTAAQKKELTDKMQKITLTEL
jgi:hypothetical protein